MANSTAASADEGHCREVSVVRATDAAGQSRSGYIFMVNVEAPTSQGLYSEISTTNAAVLADQERHREISMINAAASVRSLQRGYLSNQHCRFQPAEAVIDAFR